MSDVGHDRLYQVAEQQAGYFTAGQAIEAGIDRSTLGFHARPGGRYMRIRRGLYRLRHFPSSPHEHIVAAWLPLKSAQAVVSHSSALELIDLSDLIPEAVHVSVPRAKRGLRPRAGVKIHTLEHVLGSTEVRTMAGVLLTSPERTVVDCLEDGTQPDQIELAIQQALNRGLVTARRLRAAAGAASSTTQKFINDAISQVET